MSIYVNFYPMLIGTGIIYLLSLFLVYFHGETPVTLYRWFTSSPGKATKLITIDNPSIYPLIAVLIALINPWLAILPFIYMVFWFVKNRPEA